jgi:hypothetical protein
MTGRTAAQRQSVVASLNGDIEAPHPFVNKKKLNGKPAIPYGSRVTVGDASPAIGPRLGLVAATATWRCPSP